MDIRTIKKLIELVKETGITKLEVKGEKESVLISNGVEGAHLAQPVSLGAFQEGRAQTLPAMFSPTQEQNTQVAAQSPQGGEISAQHTIKSPMVGTVYLSASPGAKVFADIGQHVKEGDVVCLIEAMKMFNRIEADKEGTIKAILVKNGQPVEYNQQLFIIE
ncbi:MAG: acetyl-CoA carboxylase, biotin carboxyl carrier protein [Gammaproteobacteria bacterium GWE2_37_16]|nr:MAG: acetyl-CoA carboxylase, biotin carboxyl carrier protein [Gammaproteobacteria bacterium GWE2_37_16]